ncbi:MAG TPA: DNA mismatch repair protein MutS [Thermoanaerobaculia bacterium]|nr:DNA mismatch repair protein MutS [Thermoanaerobaculia bacterium]
MTDPCSIYETRLASHRAEATTLRARERNLSIARIVFFAVAVIIAIVHFSGWVAIPIVGFIALMVAHDRTITRRRRADAAARFCERGIERLSGQWQGKGVSGTGYADEHHLFAADLDLFGKGSLYEWLCIAATSAGRATLAKWLMHPGETTAAEVEERQEAVEELRGLIDLREEIAIAAAEVAHDVEEAKLDEWSRPESVFDLRKSGERIAAIIITVFTGIALILGVPSLVTRFVNITNPGAMPQISLLWSLPLLVMSVVVSFFTRGVSERVAKVVGAVERREPALALLAGLLAVLERQSFTSPRLVTLRGRLERNGVTASHQIERLRKLVALLDARRNQFFAPLALLLLWSAHIAFAIERWRVESGAEIVQWIDSIGEIEALLSLASFAFEHPAFVMPEIVEGDALFDGDAIGHPLIPDDRRVANDVRIGGELRLLIVSGSNMSGKSTLLRAIGVNTLLALAGAPVCATRLRVSPMAAGASISLNDSLQEGASRFYAEILRIRDILRVPPPLLFLLDEVLGGTNSHDRRIGAAAIVRSLVVRGAIGLATTHDLALAQIAEELAPRAANVHFEDRIEDGRVIFDYKKRPGVVTKSNALELMRAVGIEV